MRLSVPTWQKLVDFLDYQGFAMQNVITVGAG
jgi:hypothetical protein